jgi:hypothetical protein
MGKVTVTQVLIFRINMGRLGFEPRTSRLKAEYSTVELATLEQKSLFFEIKLFFFWEILQDTLKD